MSAASRWEWLDFDENESKQVRDFLSQDVEGEGIDPLRIGASVRDRIADHLFPGTSTQYTRLRYVFLVPAILRKRGATTGNLAQSQLLLNSALDEANAGEKGIIGRRTPGRDFVHLYWTAVRTWGLLTALTADPRDITVANGLAAMRTKAEADEEGNLLSENRVQWEPAVIKLVDQFWNDQKLTGWPSIQCSQAEVDFILDKWENLPAVPALAAIAVQLKKGHKLSKAKYPWEVPIGRNNEARIALDRAKTVSLVCWAVQLAYNFALLKKAEKLQVAGIETTWTRKGQNLGATEMRIAKLFGHWQTALAAEKPRLEAWTDPHYWSPLGSDISRNFLAGTAKMLSAGKTDLRSSEWASWAESREKVNPAPKLSNSAHLATWSGTPEMAQRWDFRWSASVRRFIEDVENAHG